MSAIQAMDTPFVPDAFEVPRRVEQKNFVLRPLTTNDAERDYEAVMSSKERLRREFSEDEFWPADDMTLQDNLRDLQFHQADFEQRRSFTYTVETPAGDLCLGCVYIYPCHRAHYDAQIYYWVRDSVIANGFDEELGVFVRQWLRQVWPFKQPVYPGRDLPWCEWKRLGESTT